MVEMNLRRRSLALLMAVGMSMSFVPSVSAVTFSNCANISADYSPTWHVFRLGTFYAAQGEVVIRQLRGCTNASGSALQNCAAQVWPANMQGAFGTDFKQIGYANVGTPSDPAPCNSSAMDWFATCCSGWTDNVSPMTLAFDPVVGHTIRFSIYRYAPGGLVYWRLKVDDLSHPGWYGWRELVQSASSVGEVWYGIEEHSKQSQFGSNSSTNRTRLRGLSYRLSNGSAWTYLTGTSNVAWANADLGRPSCWKNGITTYSGPIDTDQTDVNGFTTSTC